MPKKPEPINTEEVEKPPESPVAPVESSETAPSYEQTVSPETGEACWNCDGRLKNGVCNKCGFDKSLLHNLDLEAVRAAEIQKVATK